MSSLLYLLKLSISLSVIWLFYQLMLRRLTFYNLNRWYLLGYSLLSFFIPLIDIGSLLKKDTFQGVEVIQYIPVIGGYAKGAPPPDLSLFSRPEPWNILAGILLLGSVVLLIRLSARWLSLRQVRRRATLISGGGVKIFQVDQSILPFSFGNAIYINQRLHTEKEYSAIILHEYVHIRQRHTADILLAELLCIVNWYNPFAWLIRHSIRQNLEFIADRKVLEKGLDKKGYQYHLLQVVGTPRYRLANSFNFSSLKKRIIMMNKIKSARTHLLKFLFIVPLLATLLLAFRDKINSTPAAGPLVSLKMRGHGVAAPGISAHFPGFPAPAGDTALFVHGPISLVSASPSLTPQKEKSLPGFLRSTLSSDTLPKKSDSAKPLYVVDGEQMRENWAVDSISPQDIQSVEVLKGGQALRLFGAKGKNGVIAITTKKANLPFSAPVTAPAPEQTFSVVPVPASSVPSSALPSAASVSVTLKKVSLGIDSSGPFRNPIYIKDGVEIQDMKSINPDDIESITVLKDADPHGKYGERGINGVILIQTKIKRAPGEQQTLIMDYKGKERMTIRADKFDWTAEKGPENIVGFHNGRKLPFAVSAQSLMSGTEGRDALVIECTDKEEYLKKYGVEPGQTIVNFVNKANKDNPAAYILDYK